jgi:GxxExxY protein
MWLFGKGDENSMRVSLSKLGHQVEQQFPIEVIFEEENVGECFADLLIDNKVVIELKVAQSILPKHESQLLNYLKATGHQVGLLLNFGSKAEFRRKVFTNTTT